MRKKSYLQKRLTGADVRLMFTYKHNGWLTWKWCMTKVRSEEDGKFIVKDVKISNGSKTEGEMAGYIHNGKRMVTIKGFTIAARDLVWLMHYNELPPSGVKHLNGDRTDDRIENIGPVKPSEWVPRLRHM